MGIWYASTNVYRDGFHGEAVPADFQAHHAGAAVQGLGLVEDEVADAIVDFSASIILNGLQGVGVMTHQHVGPRIYQPTGFQPLAGHGLQCVLTAPVQ